VQVCIICSAGFASRRCLQVISNVRLHLPASASRVNTARPWGSPWPRSIVFSTSGAKLRDLKLLGSGAPPWQVENLQAKASRVFASGFVATSLSTQGTACQGLVVGLHRQLQQGFLASQLASVRVKSRVQPNPSFKGRSNGGLPGLVRGHVYIFLGPGLAAHRRPPP
jgi:hypothetical protein